jgi:hypothetical protein
MKYYKYMNKVIPSNRILVYVLLMLVTTPEIFSQSDTIVTEQVDDKSKPDSGNYHHSLYAGLGYGNNMLYLGSTMSQNQSFGYAALAYRFSKDFNASASSYHLADIYPFMAFYNISLSWDHTFNSWFDISTGLSGYQATKTLSDTLFNNFLYGDITLGFDWRLVYSKLSFGGLFSDEKQAYVQLKNSRYFQTREFLKGKAFISFDPYLNLLFGTLIKAESSSGTSYTVSTPYRKWRSGGRNSGTTTSNPTVSYSRTFSLMEIEFGVPVSLNFDFMTIQAEASYVLPAYSNSDFPGPKGFVFLLSGYFRIF